MTITADRLKNAAATKKLAIFDAFEILTRYSGLEQRIFLTNKPSRNNLKTTDLLKDSLKKDLSNVRTKHYIEIVTPVKLTTISRLEQS